MDQPSWTSCLTFFCGHPMARNLKKCKGQLLPFLHPWLGLLFVTFLVTSISWWSIWSHFCSWKARIFSLWFLLTSRSGAPKKPHQLLDFFCVCFVLDVSKGSYIKVHFLHSSQNKLAALMICRETHAKQIFNKPITSPHLHPSPHLWGFLHLSAVEKATHDRVKYRRLPAAFFFGFVQFLHR